MTKGQKERLREAGRKIWEGRFSKTHLFHEGMADLAGLIDREWAEKGLGEVLGCQFGVSKRLKKKVETIRKAKEARGEASSPGSEV